MHPFSKAAARASAVRRAAPAPRAVTTSARLVEVLHEILDPHSMDHRPGRRMWRTASRRNAAFLPLLSTRWTAAPARSASAQAITSPGKPAPEPRSTQRLASGASGQELERVGDVPGPDLRDRRGRDQIGLRLPSQQQARRTRSSRAAVSRETGTSSSARARSAARSAGAIFCCGVCAMAHAAGRPLPRRTCATSSVSAAGVMPSIRPAWPMVRGRSACSFCRTSFERPGSAA